MSGGVDSSVAAYLTVKAGYDCIGTTMRLYNNEDSGVCGFHTCCSARDIEDAAEVAFELDIPYEVLDVRLPRDDNRQIRPHIRSRRNAESMHRLQQIHEVQQAA